MIAECDVFTCTARVVALGAARDSFQEWLVREGWSQTPMGVLLCPRHTSKTG